MGTHDFGASQSECILPFVFLSSHDLFRILASGLCLAFLVRLFQLSLLDSNVAKNNDNNKNDESKNDSNNNDDYEVFREATENASMLQDSTMKSKSTEVVRA